jgi:hypothetical protein
VDGRSNPVREATVKLVREATRRWSEQLIDVAGRNSLLHYRDLQAGTLDLAGADETALAAVHAGRAMPLAKLFPDAGAHADAVKRARTIRNKARELLEERGIETCYLASGMATWVNPKGGATPSAPVLLRSAQLRARGAAEEDFDLTVAADAVLNPVLVHILAADFDVRFDADQVADLPEPDQVFERLAKESADRVRGFTIKPKRVLSTFSYAKLPMVTDLGAATDALAAHDVVAAIAGDRDAQAALRVPAEIDPSAPDAIPPDQEFLVLDADSSQHLALNAVLSGQHAVVKGPPGTGKSQTIANLIASLVARGMRVLFVAEKRAAITAVTDRLTRRGLGQLVMDVHDGTATRRRVAAELKTAYEAASRIALPDNAGLHETLTDRRARLAAYAKALHEPRPPWNVSVFAARAALLALPPPGTVRFRGAVLAALDAATTRKVRDLIREYGALGGLTASTSTWHNSTVASPQQAQEVWLALGRIASDAPAALDAIRRTVASVGLASPRTLSELRDSRELIDGVAATLTTFRPEIFSPELPEMAGAVHVGRFRRWRLRRRAAALTRRPVPSVALASGALSAALDQQERWTGPHPPRVPDGWSSVRAAYEPVETDVDVVAGCLPHVDVWQLPVDVLGGFAANLARDDRALRQQPRRLELTASFDRLALGPLVDELRAHSDGDPVARFDACWNASIIEHMQFSDPVIGSFDPAVHERMVAEFRASDVAHIDAAARRVLRAVAEHIVTARDQYPDEDRLVEHQSSLKRRHLPMRQLFAAAPHMLTALKPCWAMSPLVVSQLLPADEQYFDVVIFDEASQVTPADAVPAILRGRQIVVAGDEHQLPPTAFFSSAGEVGDSAVGVTADGAIDLSLTSGYESILDVLTALLPAYLLRWHYRSRDARLIAFSNAFIYDRRLVTFPGAEGSRLSHVLVDSTADAGGESAPTEVERVVALVLEHAQMRPQETLGVIAMGVVHAERLDTALRKALAGRPDLHGFFAETAPEPFFIKNLERVQGDERDAIILSVGYGKTPDGRLLYRFGPLLTAGGERRLNVAVTRARSRMTVVSSFAWTDMDPDRSAARGVHLLREYLRYAASHGDELDGVGGPAAELSPFERDVRDRLTAAGVPVTPRYGVTGQHIEFVAAHPFRPDLVLAVETDGPAYVAAGTVRDRDRLRPEQLSRLGWRLHRIWSTDWFDDPDSEVTRVASAYWAAVAETDTATAAVSEPVAPARAVADDGGSRGPRPPLQPGLPITAYRHTDLVDLIRWIESDTLLRTEDEILDEVIRELGFARRGPRIREAVTVALAAARTGDDGFRRAP